MIKEELEKLIIERKSAYEIARELNSSQTNVLYHIKKFGLRDNYIKYANYKKGGGKISWDIHKLESAIKDSNSYSECLEKLGLVPRGHNFRTLYKKIEEAKINTSHFNHKKARASSLSEFYRRKYPIENYLISGSKISSVNLKSRLYKEKILSPICSICGQDENWMGRKISLILDHIDGNHNNNIINNLRIVCPNCNASLDTFCGRNLRPKIE